jgi:hypothetical protein
MTAAMEVSPLGPARSGAAVARTAAGAGSRRPLFLGPALRGRVDIDGPALRVRAEGRAEVRFPLERVSRVVASVRLSWSADALRACLESLIPIVMVGADGAPLGSFQPARLRPSRFEAALAELLDRPDWRDLYGCWLRSARMRVLDDWRRARREEGGAPDEGAYRALVRRYVYRHGAAPAAPSAAHETTAFWRAALYALATATTARWGLPPLLWGHGGEAIDLRRDLADLLELRLRLEVREEAEAALKGEATMLFVFHALTDKLDLEAKRAMRSLARRLREALSEWR